MTGRVVHVADKVPGAIYIGRRMNRQRLKASPFANPYHILPGIAAREDVIVAYADYLRQSPHLIAMLPELRGLPLACWCRHDGQSYSLDTACHGDVLLAILSDTTDDELRAQAEEGAA